MTKNSKVVLQDDEESNLPKGMGKPAFRALSNAGYLRLEQFSKLTETEVAQLHGVGPKALNLIRLALAERGLSFADGSNKKLVSDGKKAMRKSTAKSGHEQVVQYLNNLDHPFKKEIEVVRRIILDANNQLTEHIKWNAPSFCFNGEDRITFNLHGNGFFRLVFHCGAKVKDSAKGSPLFEDTTGLLEWSSGDRAVAKFTDIDDVKEKEDRLAAVVTKWLEATSSLE